MCGSVQTAEGTVTQKTVAVVGARKPKHLLVIIPDILFMLRALPSDDAVRDDNTITSQNHRRAAVTVTERWAILTD